MNAPLQQVVWQLLTEAPLFLVFAVGFVAALVYHERAPRPAALILFGTGLSALTLLVFTCIEPYLIEMCLKAGWSSGVLDLFLRGLAFVWSVLEAIGTGLILAGVFVGRGRPAR